MAFVLQLGGDRGGRVRAAGQQPGPRVDVDLDDLARAEVGDEQQAAAGVEARVVEAGVVAGQGDLGYLAKRQCHLGWLAVAGEQNTGHRGGNGEEHCGGEGQQGAGAEATGHVGSFPGLEIRAERARRRQRMTPACGAEQAADAAGGDLTDALPPNGSPPAASTAMEADDRPLSSGGVGRAGARGRSGARSGRRCGSAVRRARRGRGRSGSGRSRRGSRRGRA